jgi:hypothetical protein
MRFPLSCCLRFCLTPTEAASHVHMPYRSAKEKEQWLVPMPHCIRTYGTFALNLNSSVEDKICGPAVTVQRNRTDSNRDNMQQKGVMKTQSHKTLTLRGDDLKEYEESFKALCFYAESARDVARRHRILYSLDCFAEYTNCIICLQEFCRKRLI